MRARYYFHMGPRSADKVSLLWKGLHIILFLLIVVSASVATWTVYRILEMYNFNCVLYAKISFEQTLEERRIMMNLSSSTIEPPDNDTVPTNTSLSSLDCTAYPNDPRCQDITSRPGRYGMGRFLLTVINWRAYVHYKPNTTFHKKKINNTGFINLRKTAFTTIYTCDLMFFSPLASIVMAVFLGALTLVGGRGGAGNPGDLFPNPWICVYPFLGLCGFMIVLSFIAQNLFYTGLNEFCRIYIDYTKEYWCTEEMNKYTVQFTKRQEGPPQNFYFNFFTGGIALRVTSVLWVLQALVYVFRILCLADFTTYLTRIRVIGEKRGPPDPKMANLVLKVVDPSKIKNF